MKETRWSVPPILQYNPVKCLTTSWSPVLTLGAICVPPTVNYLQYIATGSTLTAVGPFQLPAPQSGTLSRISSGTRPSVQIVSDVCLKHICSLDTSAFSALWVLDDNAIYKSTYLLTYRWSEYVTPEPPKGGSKSEFVIFVNKNQFKSEKLCYKVSLCENFQRQSCSRTTPLSNHVYTLAVNVTLEPNI